MRIPLSIWRVLRDWLVLGVLVVSVALCSSRAERYGDRLQIALPLVALGCSVVNGGSGELLARFTGGLAAVHATKNATEGYAFNQRPHGGPHGFPSAHTYSATFGASALVSDCVKNSLVVRVVVIISAAFVGASRIEAKAHDIWQVLSGAIFGMLAERALRIPGRLRTPLVNWLRRHRRRITQTLPNPFRRFPA